MNRSAKSVSTARILSWVILVVTGTIIVFFVVKTGMLSGLVKREKLQTQTVSLPDQVSSGLSTITGFDKDKQPYKLTARKVVQDAGDDKIAHLTTVDAILKKKNGDVLTMVSRKGVYKSEKKVLDLMGKVRLKSKDKFVARMEKATVILKEKRLYAKVPVTVEFDRGSIVANAMEVSENGKKILFFDGVKTRYEPAAEGNRNRKSDKKEN